MSFKFLAFAAAVFEVLRVVLCALLATRENFFQLRSR